MISSMEGGCESKLLHDNDIESHIEVRIFVNLKRILKFYIV